MKSTKVISALIADALFFLDNSAMFSADIRRIKKGLHIDLMYKSVITLDLNSLEEVIGEEVVWNVKEWDEDTFNVSVVQTVSKDTEFIPKQVLGTVEYVCEVLAFIVARHKSQATLKPETIQVNLRGSVVIVGSGAKDEEAMVTELRSLVPSDIAELQETLSTGNPIYMTGIDKLTPAMEIAKVKLSNTITGIRQVLIHPELVELPALYGLLASL